MSMEEEEGGEMWEEGELREVGERGGEVGKREDPAGNASENGVMWEHGESGEMWKEGEGEDGEWQEAVN